MIFLDIETLDFFQDERIKALPRAEQLAAIRFGIAVTYCDQRDEWREWLPDQLPDLWGYLFGHDIGGWNIADFDIPIIEHNLRSLGHRPREGSLVLHDIFQQIRTKTGRWYKLETVSQANFGRGKSADGQQAAEWLREWQDKGDQEALRKALDYCRLDVELERDLHLHLAQQPLRLPPRPDRRELNEILYYADGTTKRIPDATGAISTK